MGATMRLAMLPLCLALAGCLTNEEPAPAAATPPPTQPSAAAPAAAPEKPAPAQRRAAPAAARASNAPPAPPPQPAEEPVDPILQIRQTCWSQGNANKSFKSLEARADWVNGCITEKMKALR